MYSFALRNDVCCGRFGQSNTSFETVCYLLGIARYRWHKVRRNGSKTIRNFHNEEETNCNTIRNRGSNSTIFQTLIAGINGIAKPVVHNQWKVEPYPKGRGRSYAEHRAYEVDKYRGMSRGGRGHRWSVWDNATVDFWFKEHFVLFNWPWSIVKCPNSISLLFLDFCRKFCGEDLYFDEARVKTYYQKMDALKDLVVKSGSKKQRTV